MPRDSNGTYTLPEASFTPTSTIFSAEVNNDFADLAEAITQSAAPNGSNFFTGPIKAIVGSVGAPGLSFRNNTSAGVFISATNQVGGVAAGALIWGASVSGLFVSSARIAKFANVGVNSVFNQGFAGSTAALFVQGSAPLGWTRTTASDKALRVVSGTVINGGTIVFSSVFATQLTDITLAGASLSTDQIPGHQHFIANSASATVSISGSNSVVVQDNTLGAQGYTLTATASMAQFGISSTTGEGSMHDHTWYFGALNANIQYVDVIIATKG